MEKLERERVDDTTRTKPIELCEQRHVLSQVFWRVVTAGRHDHPPNRIRLECRACASRAQALRWCEDRHTWVAI